MKLVGIDPGTRLYLSIVGYQFPRKKVDNWWDRNWLVVKGDVRLTSLVSGRKILEWHFKDPCLTTDEVASLAEWLRLVSWRLKGVRKPRLGSKLFPRKLTFTEPNLAFFFDGRDIEVSFAHESAPPKPLPEIHGGRLCFPGQVNDFEVAAIELENQLARFPVRPDGGRT